MGQYLSSGAAFSFFFSFLFSVPKLTEANIKKKRTEQPTQEKEKKKVKSGQKVQLVLFVGPLCMFNYNIVIELWVMENENSQNIFLVSTTHNSKIRELSDGNRLLETKLSFAKQPFCYGSHHFWVMSYDNR